MPYELRLTSTSEWRHVTKTEANRRATRHYLQERLAALFGLVDRGMILDCNGHGQIRRKPGRWDKRQRRMFESIKKGDRVTIQTRNGDRQTLRAVRQMRNGDWKLSEGRAVWWNVVEVKGAKGGTKRKRKRKKTRKKKTARKRAASLSGLDALDSLDTLEV